MLAFAPNTETTPIVVDRFYWRLFGRVPGPDRPPQPVAVAGTVKQPFYAPQGEVAGAVLEDGTVVLLPEGISGGAEGLRDLLKSGARLAAEGTGMPAADGGEGGEAAASLVAERLGEDRASLRPVVPPAAASAPPAAAPPR